MESIQIGRALQCCVIEVNGRDVDLGGATTWPPLKMDGMHLWFEPVTVILLVVESVF